jgi:hypothetical protein
MYDLQRDDLMKENLPEETGTLSLPKLQLH